MSRTTTTKPKAKKNENLFNARTKKKQQEKLNHNAKAKDGLSFAEFKKRKEIFGNLNNGNDDFKLEVNHEQELYMIAYYSVDYGQPLPDNYMTSEVQWKKSFHIDHVHNFIQMYKHVYENNRVFRNVNTIEKLMSILKNFDVDTYKERCRRLYENSVQGLDYDQKEQVIERKAQEMMFLKMGRRKVLFSDILYIPEYDIKGQRIFQIENINEIIV